MENSIFLAKLLGPYCIIVSAGILFNLRIYQKLIEDFFKNSAILYMGGILALFFGLLIVLFHNVWEASWTVIITIFGWIGIIKGIWLIVFPAWVGKFTEVYQKKTALLRVNLVIVFAIGAVLTIFGYFIG
jgi:hypothetical protein